MKYLNQRYKILVSLLLVGLLAVGFSGCEDQLLDKKPRGELTQESFFETEQHAIQATNASYEKLRDFWVHSFGWVGMTDIASDDASKGSTPSDNPEMLSIDNFTFTPTNGLFRLTWQGYYQGIFRTNLAIQNIPGIDMDTTLRDRLVGENKFIRAYLYFFLVRAFGDVPLVLQPLEPDEFRQPRAPASDVYDQIEQDLLDAIEVLPLKSEYAASNLGRITQGAAQSLLAKVYLYRDKNEEALQMAENVINSGEYQLLDDFDQIFRPEGENSSESIFEIQAVANSQGLGGAPYGVIQSARGTPNLGWGFNTPNRDLLESFEAGDHRMQSTMLFVHETLPYGEEDVVRDNSGMNDERYNQKAFVPLDSPSGTFNGGTNIRRIRYSDVILIAAEAAQKTGDEATARDYVNMVRERARGDMNATVGLVVEPLSSVVADTIGMSNMEDHVFIRYANIGGPADGAGLESLDWELVNNDQTLQVNTLDLITSIDGVSVTSVSDFNNEMSSKDPGQQIAVTVERVTQTFSNGQLSTNTETVVATMTTEELLPDVSSSGQQLLEDIWHERRVELAMEQQRFFDIQRQGRAGELLRAQGKEYQDDKHNVYPIPQSELDLNSEMQQNPNY
ncbi:RagB/SusD family nutrient uptake outer membrane protein [Aliifodinibius sp. S!AR15-10]|uniref:RagB/SusD family nutrient uptake outer membrane protein n=1 Tax=Aliifodinibius sp. S!AR15-10 TaxID=2950437 RepID=UPI002866E27D|nr:RagB/SusD family nutrient uptake outer membrane protein [Aliifodinibius sp. S!AR15-10]MDR8389802.1 RagB/SusD family nutrient uptake outer membrane protein [Aliifodinibius sp. S!AR15-10]